MKSIKKMLLIVLTVVMAISGSALVASAAGSVKKTNISAASATAKNVTYNGKSQSPQVTVKLGSTTLVQGVDYTVNFSALHSGTYTFTITGIGRFEGTTTATFTIKGTATATQNKITAKAAKTTVKRSAVKKKAQKIKITVKKAKNNKGKVTYSISKTAKKLQKYIKVNKNGKVTLKKGAKKGTYKITVKVAGYKKYAPKTKTIKIKVK